MSNNNYYNLNFPNIYLNATGKNCTKEVKKVLDKLPGVDFNNVDEIAEKLKSRGNADTMVAKEIKILAAFIVHLNDTELAKLAINDKQFLVGKSGVGTYHAKVCLLNKKYDEGRKADAAPTAPNEEVDKLPTVTEYNNFYDKNLEKAKTFLQQIVFTPEDANTFLNCFLVCWKHDLPDMRGGSTLADMLTNHQSPNYNYVIHSTALEMIIIVYNCYKTSGTYGTITEIIDKEHPLYELFDKAMYISKQYKVDYLFYDYIKKREYTAASFNLLIGKTHEELGITQRQLRIIDESTDLDGVNPVADMGQMIMDRERRGHNLLEGLSYAKRMRQ